MSGIHNPPPTAFLSRLFTRTCVTENLPPSRRCGGSSLRVPHCSSARTLEPRWPRSLRAERPRAEAWGGGALVLDAPCGEDTDAPATAPTRQGTNHRGGGGGRSKDQEPEESNTPKSAPPPPTQFCLFVEAFSALKRSWRSRAGPEEAAAVQPSAHPHPPAGTKGSRAYRARRISAEVTLRRPPWPKRTTRRWASSSRRPRSSS